jgi:hypothetical protein
MPDHRKANVVTAQEYYMKIFSKRRVDTFIDLRATDLAMYLFLASKTNPMPDTGLEEQGYMIVGVEELKRFLFTSTTFPEGVTPTTVHVRECLEALWNALLIEFRYHDEYSVHIRMIGKTTL